jgi:hypoxanthine phosphoribosyltransferase
MVEALTDPFTWRDWHSFLGTAIGFLGLAIAGVEVVKRKKAERALEAMEWREVDFGARRLARDILASSYRPALMLAPDSRGGLIARQIAQQLHQDGINIPVLVGVTVWKKGTRFQGDLSMYDFLQTKRWDFGLPKACYANPDRDILIVDDIVYSGASLEQARQHLTQNGVPRERIRTATLVVSHAAIKADSAPDFYVRVTRSDNFLFPWGDAL